MSRLFIIIPRIIVALCILLGIVSFFLGIGTHDYNFYTILFFIMALGLQGAMK